MLLTELLLVFFVAGVVVYIFQRLKIPAVVGLLVSGVVVGPHGLGWVHDVEHVNLLAEIGVVVLLFTVGLEFSLSRVLAMTPLMMRVGLPQIAISVLVTIAATWWYFGGFNPAFFAGMMIAMSSTAIVLKLYADRGELGAPQGRIAVAVLLLQDLLVVVCVLLVPMLSPTPPEGTSLWWSMGWGLATVISILVAGKYVIPAILFRIVQTRNRELFLIAIFVVCIGTATITGWVGLSLALGAFLAGLTLAESEYGYQTLAEVLPFRDTLSSLFFVSVGMLLDMQFLATHFPLIAASVVALIALKFASVAVPTLFGGQPLRVAVLAGIGLAQIGEFSFVLASSGLRHGLLNASDYQTFLSAAVLTMCATPFLIQSGPAIVAWLERFTIFQRWCPRECAENDGELGHLDDHVLIAGYGFNGRNLAAAFRDLNIAYVVLDTNPETVRTQRAAGESILFGDCTRTPLLEHAGIRHARAYVVGISDPVSTRQTVQLARQLNPKLRIIVRTRYRAEIDQLRALGADDVIPEEFEASVEVFARTLRLYDIPGNVISGLVSRIRADHYEVFRDEGFGRDRLALPHGLLGQAETETCLIDERSPAVGHTLGDLALRNKTGASVIALRRGTEILSNPGPDALLLAGDVVVLLGSHEQIERGTALLTLETPQQARAAG